MNAALVCNKVSQTSLKISCHMRTKFVVKAPKKETFLTLELSQYCKCASTFFLQRACRGQSHCSRLGNALSLGSAVLARLTVQERCPKS